MGNQSSTIQPEFSQIKKPELWPNYPTPGKLELLWNTNNSSMYHRLSPYSQYSSNQGLIKGFTIQPYWYVYPDENKKGLNALRKYQSQLFPIGDAPIDVIRVAKFLGSGTGITFLGKQFLLQTGNPYNETRIYNPTSPLVAAGMALGLGTIRPMRHIDLSGGLLGIASSLFGSSIPSLFGTPAVTPPSGTTGLGALSDSMKSTGGKGLLRAGTAERGRAHLLKEWPQVGNISTRAGFFSAVANMAKSLFANFIPQTQSGMQYRSDEGAYGLMISSGPNGRFKYLSSKGIPFEFGPAWFAGGKIMRKNKQTPQSYKMFVKYDSNGMRTSYIIYAREGYDKSVAGMGQVGYTATESADSNAPGMRYGDNVGTFVSDRTGEDYTNSDVMRQFAEYADPSQEFPTKQTKQDITSKLNLNMLKVLTKLGEASGQLYSIEVPADSKIIGSGKANKNGYDRLFAGNKRGSSPINYAESVIKNYRDSSTSMVDNSLTNDVRNSKKLPTAGHFDAINTLEVLGKDRKINNSKLKGWDTWEPYKDDLIALYFYDAVNEKYIPFRAAIKGLSEAGNASWEEMPFIGRGDKVYSYGGFNRNLSLTINIVINSLAELAPTWQRINYLTTLVKPANYTTSKFAGAMNRFMVPPMVMLTLGDMYKNQPVLIQTITTTIPDDALWETQNEFNSTQWEYLANYMKSSKVLYGQLPRSMDISLGLILLEKERAIVGGANFGHAPRQDQNYQLWNSETVPDSGAPNKLHQSLVVSKNNDKMFSSTREKALDTQNSTRGEAAFLTNLPN